MEAARRGAGVRELESAQKFVVAPKGRALTLGSVRDASQFAALRSEWNRLLDASDAGPFNAWEWLYPWYCRLGLDRELMILTARDGEGELLGLMPLCLSRVWAAGRKVVQLSWLGETHVGSDYLDVIARRGLEEDVSRVFTRAIRAARGLWDVLELVDIDQDSPTLGVLRAELGGDGYNYRVTDRYTCPYERFGSNETFDAFLRHTRRRENYLRRKKWLELQPGYALEVATGSGELSRSMADFFWLHALRWASDGGSQGIRGPAIEGFHRDATQYLAERGALRLFTLRLGEQALASVYALVHQGRFIYFQSGYDPAWGSRSVGLVLVGETFRYAIESGLSEYDFLRGREAYKSDWTTKERKTLAVRVCPRGGKGEWLTRQQAVAKAMRKAAKKVLPRGWVERIRRFIS